jgi:hypothetical protein
MGSGVTAGPYLLGLLNETSVQQLWFIDQACLSVIALAAGAELRWEQVASTKRQVRPCRKLSRWWPLLLCGD